MMKIFMSLRLYKIHPWTRSKIVKHRAILLHSWPGSHSWPNRLCEFAAVHRAYSVLVFSKQRQWIQTIHTLIPRPHRALVGPTWVATKTLRRTDPTADMAMHMGVHSLSKIMNALSVRQYFAQPEPPASSWEVTKQEKHLLMAKEIFEATRQDIMWNWFLQGLPLSELIRILVVKEKCLPVHVCNIFPAILYFLYFTATDASP